MALESFSDEHGESRAPHPTHIANASLEDSVQLLSLCTRASGLLEGTRPFWTFSHPGALSMVFS